MKAMLDEAGKALLPYVREFKNACAVFEPHLRALAPWVNPLQLTPEAQERHDSLVAYLQTPRISVRPQTDEPDPVDEPAHKRVGFDLPARRSTS